MYLVYATCASASEAKKIALEAVKKKLAACVHVLPAGESVFFWKGKLEQKKETVLFLKCSERKFDRLERCIKKMHSHVVPCIIALDVEKVNPKFSQWVEKT